MTARDFVPTDESIEALARDEQRQSGGADWDDLRDVDRAAWFDSARCLTEFPAFHAIIADAKAEAWAQGFAAAQTYPPGWGPDPDFLNPYVRETSA